MMYPQHQALGCGSRAGAADSRKQAIIETPTDTDVLCGQDKAMQNHVGNIAFRSLILSYQDDYSKATTKKAKSNITKSIVNILKTSYNSRFIRLREDGLWEEINDRHARDKVSHALRFAQTRSPSAAATAVRRMQNQQEKVAASFSSSARRHSDPVLNSPAARTTPIDLKPSPGARSCGDVRQAPSPLIRPLFETEKFETGLADIVCSSDERQEATLDNWDVEQEELSQSTFESASMPRAMPVASWHGPQVAHPPVQQYDNEPLDASRVEACLEETFRSEDLEFLMNL